MVFARWVVSRGKQVFLPSEADYKRKHDRYSSLKYFKLSLVLSHSVKASKWKPFRGSTPNLGAPSSWLPILPFMTQEVPGYSMGLCGCMPSDMILGCFGPRFPHHIRQLSLLGRDSHPSVGRTMCGLEYSLSCVPVLCKSDLLSNPYQLETSTTPHTSHGNPKGPQHGKRPW